MIKTMSGNGSNSDINNIYNNNTNNNNNNNKYNNNKIITNMRHEDEFLKSFHHQRHF